jgi:hypothetical protein
MMVTVSLDSPSCEVTLFDPVFSGLSGRYPTGQGIIPFEARWSPQNGLAYLSRYNSGWFCHSWYQSYKVTLEIHFTLKMLSV